MDATCAVQCSSWWAQGTILFVWICLSWNFLNGRTKDVLQNKHRHRLRVSCPTRIAFTSVSFGEVVGFPFIEKNNEKLYTNLKPSFFSE